MSVAKNMNVVLSGLMHRYEVMCKPSHPGWKDDSSRHEAAVGRVRSRIMDTVALGYGDNDLPDVLHVTHGHRIYRVDYIEGRFDLVGTLTVDLTTYAAPVIEVN